MQKKENLYSIQQVSTKLNIPKPTLRFWEKEFEGVLQPQRTNGGQRRYTSQHISIVEEINALKMAGLSLAEIKKKLERGKMWETISEIYRDMRLEQIDILADRVANVVKLEVLRFIQRGNE